MVWWLLATLVKHFCKGDLCKYLRWVMCPPRMHSCKRMHSYIDSRLTPEKHYSTANAGVCWGSAHVRRALSKPDLVLHPFEGFLLPLEAPGDGGGFFCRTVWVCSPVRGEVVRWHTGAWLTWRPCMNMRVR